MPITLSDMNDDLIPMRSVYERNGVTSDMVAKVRKEALNAEIERPIKLDSLIVGVEGLHDSLTLACVGESETILFHRTVDHRTRLAAAEAVVEEMGLKPSKKVDVTMSAIGILAEILKEIDGDTLGISSRRKEPDE